MRAPRTASQTEIRVATLNQTGPDLGGRTRRPRRVLDRASSGQAKVIRGLGEERGQLEDGLCTGGDQGLRGLCERRVPGVEIATGMAAGKPRQQGVSLG